MTDSFKDAASAAVKVLQQWYGADLFASSTGLYSFTDPDVAADASSDPVWGPLSAAGIAALDLTTVYSDMLCWWNSANAITALIDYMLITGDQSYLSVLDKTFNNAPNAWRPDKIAIGVSAGGGCVAGAAALAWAGPLGWVAGCAIGAVTATAVATYTYGRDYNSSFMDDFYDDNAWWALAWVKAYDLTGNSKYLNMAVTIFDDMASRGWDNELGGGIYWQRDKTDGHGNAPYKNAIANELFFALAAALFIRLNNQSYLNWATSAWLWISNPATGTFNANGLIQDSPNISAGHNSNILSYNQGVILAALCDLSEITGDKTLLGQAIQIADAFIHMNTASSSQSGVDPNGILTEESDIGAPGNAGYYANVQGCQFKGIFIRNLGYLYKKSHLPRYRTFILRNATSILNNNFNPANQNQFGGRWAGPFDTADVVRQTSAVDLLNAATLAQSVPVDLSYLDPLLLDGKDSGKDLSYLQTLLQSGGKIYRILNR